MKKQSHRVIVCVGEEPQHHLKWVTMPFLPSKFTLFLMTGSNTAGDWAHSQWYHCGICFSLHHLPAETPKQMDCWPFLGAFPTTETIPYTRKQAAQHWNVQKTEESQAPNYMTAWLLTIRRNSHHGIWRNWRVIEQSERLKYASPCEMSPEILRRLHDVDQFSLQLVVLCFW